MHRYQLTLEYDGTFFHGWQFQKDLVTVQGTLQSAVTNLTGEKRIVEGCGRTDTGVHAKRQVAHVDLCKEWDLHKFTEGLNFYLRDTGVTVIRINSVSSDFHARFSTLSRTYVYHILNRLAPSPLFEKRAWHVKKPLDVPLMQRAADLFVGTHDFSAFRAADCQAKSAIKTIHAFNVWQEQEHIYLKVTARSFLHNQVRIMVGTLQQVGIRKRTPENIATTLALRERPSSGPTAPAHGLYFWEAIYA